MAVQVPHGLMKLPFSLTEKPPTVLKDSIANVESEIILWQCPKKMSVAFPAGSRLALYLRTSVPADITAGTVRAYITDANKAMKAKVLEAPIGALMAGSTGGAFNIADREKRYLLPQGFSRETDEYIIFTFEGANVADDAQTMLLMEGTQFLQV